LYGLFKKSINLKISKNPKTPPNPQIQIRVLLHTLSIKCRRSWNSKDWTPLAPESRRFQLAKDYQRALFIELLLTIPANSECSLEMDYYSAFIRAHRDEYIVHVPGPTLTFNNGATGAGKAGRRLVSVHGEPLRIYLPQADDTVAWVVFRTVTLLLLLSYGAFFIYSTTL
jgi:Gpi16 subunit, GPI transamidase component